MVTSEQKMPKQPVDVSGGTNGTHFLNFLKNLLDELDMANMKGCNLVLDNRRIHHCAAVDTLCTERGYKIIFTPSYSPFLNPIEEFWAQLKFLICRNRFDEADKEDEVVSRVMKAAKEVPLSMIHAWIENAICHFPACAEGKEIHGTRDV